MAAGAQPHHLVQSPGPQVGRQIVYDSIGNIVTDARYSQWHVFENVPFPKHIEIHRRAKSTGATIDVVKMDINKGLSDDKFVLTQPKDYAQVIGRKPQEPTRDGRLVLEKPQTPSDAQPAQRDADGRTRPSSWPWSG